MRIFCRLSIYCRLQCISSPEVEVSLESVNFSHKILESFHALAVQGKFLIISAYCVLCLALLRLCGGFWNFLPALLRYVTSLTTFTAVIQRVESVWHAFLDFGILAVFIGSLFHISRPVASSSRLISTFNSSKMHANKLTRHKQTTVKADLEFFQVQVLIRQIANFLIEIGRASCRERV